jgi:hypothetical protein
LVAVKHRPLTSQRKKKRERALALRKKELTMPRIKFALILTILLLLSSNAQAQTAAAFRVLFGVSDTSVTRWDGSFKVIQAGAYRLEPWRLDPAGRS